MNKVAKWLAVSVIVAAGVTLVPRAIVRHSEAFQAAQTFVLAQPQIQQFGNPIEVNVRYSESSMKFGDSSGDASLVLDVEGQRNHATARVRMKKDLGRWSVVEWNFVPTT